jgi:putative transposase
MGITRQGYYKHVKNEPERKRRDDLILSGIRRIRKHLNTVGGRKLQIMLKEKLAKSEVKVSRDHLFDLMRQHNLFSKLSTRYCRTTNSKHGRRVWPNLLKDLEITRPNQAWVSDITYILTTTDFCYLSLVTDVYSRRIVGYHLSRHMYTEDVMQAVINACNSVQPPEGLIHHSDKGSQYCSKKYSNFLKGKKIQISMTGPNHCYDNAIAERVNGILKLEFGLGSVIRDFATAQKLVVDSIALYNGERLHNSLGNVTPDSFYFKELAKNAA